MGVKKKNGVERAHQKNDRIAKQVAIVKKYQKITGKVEPQPYCKTIGTGTTERNRQNVHNKE